MAENGASYSEEPAQEHVLLGQGAFGRVYQATMKVAIKEIKISHHAVKEVETLFCLHHDHILKYFNHHYEDDMLFITMEFADYGTLTDRIREEAQRNSPYIDSSTRSLLRWITYIPSLVQFCTVTSSQTTCLGSQTT